MLRRINNLVFAVILSVFLLSAPVAVPAWEKGGKIYDTDLEYADLNLSKAGLAVRINNPSTDDVKVSLRLSFFDRNSNKIGYSIIGLREIPAGSFAEVSGNYISGKWKECSKAERLLWEKMTYEILY
ncbi:hypothetical protein FACS1894167_09740 [Synergistales bacterium]|nr:hypothetical protein FACS1894167_09740 [Synergistales bacterium]